MVGSNLGITGRVAVWFTIECGTGTYRQGGPAFGILVSIGTLRMEFLVRDTAAPVNSVVD